MENDVNMIINDVDTALEWANFVQNNYDAMARMIEIERDKFCKAKSDEEREEILDNLTEFTAMQDKNREILGYAIEDFESAKQAAIMAYKKFITMIKEHIAEGEQHYNRLYGSYLNEILVKPVLDMDRETLKVCLKDLGQIEKTAALVVVDPEMGEE